MAARGAVLPPRAHRIYRVAVDGTLSLLSSELSAPNGLAFSPDESFLYVDNWDPKRKVVLRFPVEEGGTLGEPTTFLDLTALDTDECFDGLEVDALGNVWASGPDGVYIVADDGTILGVLRMKEKPANFAWGDADRRTLYMTARTGVYRLRTKVGGA